MVEKTKSSWVSFLFFVEIKKSLHRCFFVSLKKQKKIVLACEKKMSERIAAQLADVIENLEPLGKRKRETQKSLLKAMVRANKTEVRSGDRVFTVKNVKKRPKSITYASLLAWYDAYSGEDQPFDFQEFVEFIKGERDKSVDGAFNQVLRCAIAAE